MKKFYFNFLSMAILVLVALNVANAQNDVMMQAFYWDVPTDESAKNGSWWDNLSGKAGELKDAGITGIWIPSPCKGNFGISDMGYAIYDHYDLGNYYQKNTTETRFGSRLELENMISVMHSGSKQIDVYADIIVNHIYAGDENFEANPAVKTYVFGEAHSGANEAYPTNEIKWVIPGATPGDYYIQIKGYNIHDDPDYKEGYEVMIDWTGSGSTGSYTWEYEPNNGMGQYNIFPSSGYTIRGHVDAGGTIDEYKVTLSSTHDIEIRLEPRREKISSFTWEWPWHADGYYPVAVWYNGSNLANTALQAQTRTNITYVTHTGTGEPNYSWNYTHFHPVDASDWLGDGGFEDQIVTNTKWFGNDLNTFDPVVQTRMNDWGYWMADEMEFDGFRLDFVRGFQESYAASWINNLPLLSGQQRFIVGEYWTEHPYRLKDWVDNLASAGADATVFDFPLRVNLQRLCNGDQNSYHMSWLNHASMYRAQYGDNLPAESIVQFVDNHDTGKEHDKWLRQDFKMAYAYILTHPGRPCLFYPHYYSVLQHDHSDPSKTIQAPSSLKDDIDELIFVRKTYIDGDVEVLSEVGNPWPSGDTKHVYVARRQGNGTKTGAIVVLNNHNSSTKGLWIDATPSGFSNWAGTTLVNAMDPSETTYVYPDGRVWVDAPARGYKVYVKQSEYVTYTKSASAPNGLLTIQPLNQLNLSVYPQPASSILNFSLNLKNENTLKIEIVNIQGKMIDILFNNSITKGHHKFPFDVSKLETGIYFAKIKLGDSQLTKKIVIK